MPLQLYDHGSTTEFRDEFGVDGEFDHSFGGSLKQFGIRCEYEQPVHLIYRLDCRDPQLAFLKKIGDFVPLLYSFAFFEEFAYRVTGEDLVEVVHVPSDLVLPLWEAPSEFPMKPIALSATEYDPKEAMEALRLKDIFGWSQLSASEKEKAVSWAADYADLRLEDAPGGSDGWTLEELVQCDYRSPFVQGPPSDECMIPNCDGTSKVIATQEYETPGELIWPELCSDTQTIWLLCEKCNCVMTTNQCT